MAKAIRDVNHILKHNKIFSYLKVLKDDTIANIKRPILPLPVLDLKSKYIPFSASTLIRLSGENDKFIKCTEDQTLLNDLSNQLYQTICCQFYQKYLEIKEQSNYNKLPKNSETNNLNRDYWLVQQINDLAISANLVELPQHYLAAALSKPYSIKNFSISAKVDFKVFDTLRIWSTAPPNNGIWGGRRDIFPPLNSLKNLVDQTLKTIKSRDKADHVISKPSSQQMLIVYKEKSVGSPLVYQLVSASDLLFTLSPGLRFEPSSGRKFLAASLGLTAAGGLFFNAFSLLLSLPMYVNDVLAMGAAAFAFKIWRVDSLRDALRFLINHLSPRTAAQQLIEKDELYRIVGLAARQKFCEIVLCYFTLLMIASRTLPISVPPPSELSSDFISPGYLELCVEAYLNHLLSLLPNTPGLAKPQNPSIEFDSHASLDWLCREGLVIQSEAPIFNESIHGYRALNLREGLEILISRQKNQLSKDFVPLGKSAFSWFDDTLDNWIQNGH